MSRHTLAHTRTLAVDPLLLAAPRGVADQADPEREAPPADPQPQERLPPRQNVAGLPSEETSRAPGISHTSRISTT